MCKIIASFNILILLLCLYDDNAHNKSLLALMMIFDDGTFSQKRYFLQTNRIKSNKLINVKIKGK